MKKKNTHGIKAAIKKHAFLVVGAVIVLFAVIISPNFDFGGLQSNVTEGEVDMEGKKCSKLANKYGELLKDQYSLVGDYMANNEKLQQIGIEMNEIQLAAAKLTVVISLSGSYTGSNAQPQKGSCVFNFNALGDVLGPVNWKVGSDPSAGGKIQGQ